MSVPKVEDEAIWGPYGVGGIAATLRCFRRRLETLTYRITGTISLARGLPEKRGALAE
jgi:hypothetical protein